jgi:hypothetical protein
MDFHGTSLRKKFEKYLVTISTICGPLPPPEGADHPSNLSARASQVRHALPKLRFDPGRARARAGRHAGRLRSRRPRPKLDSRTPSSEIRAAPPVTALLPSYAPPSPWGKGEKHIATTRSLHNTSQVYSCRQKSSHIYIRRHLHTQTHVHTHIYTRTMKSTHILTCAPEKVSRITAVHAF